MNKNKVEKPIVKMAFGEAKKRFIIDSLPLMLFALLFFAILVLGFFAPLTLFLTIPFIAVPSFFSLNAINTLATNKNTREGAGFFIMYRAYYSQPFNGGYRLWLALLKAVIVFTVVSFVTSFILVSTTIMNDSSFVEFANSLNEVQDLNVMVEMFDEFISGNKTFNTVLFIDNAVSFFAAMYVFIHHFSVNSIKYNYNFIAKLPLPMSDLNAIFKSVYKKNRRSMLKDYFKCYWFLTVLLVMGYAGGILLSYFVIPNIDVLQASVVGMFFSFILLILFVPYYMNASSLIFDKYKGQYIETLIDMSRKSLEELKKSNTITAEKEKQVMEIIESQKKDIENDDNNKSN